MFKRALLFSGLVALMACAASLLSSRHGMTVIEAQSFPLTVKIGVAPDLSATAPMGYTVATNGGTPVDLGLPASVSCKDFVGGAASTCVPLSVSIPAAGSYSVAVVGYNLGGNSPATTIAFQVTNAPGASGGLRVVK